MQKTRQLYRSIKLLDFIPGINSLNIIQSFNNLNTQDNVLNKTNILEEKGVAEEDKYLNPQIKDSIINDSSNEFDSKNPSSFRGIEEAQSIKSIDVSPDSLSLGDSKEIFTNNEKNAEQIDNPPKFLHSEVGSVSLIKSDKFLPK